MDTLMTLVGVKKGGMEFHDDDEVCRLPRMYGLHLEPSSITFAYKLNSHDGR